MNVWREEVHDWLSAQPYKFETWVMLLSKTTIKYIPETTLATRTSKPKNTLDHRRHINVDIDQFKSKPIILIKVMIGLIDQSRSVISDVNDRALAFRSIFATLQTCTALQLSRNGRFCFRYYKRSSWSNYFKCTGMYVRIDISTKLWPQLYLHMNNTGTLSSMRSFL